MIEKIKFEDVERNLPSGTPNSIRGVNSVGNAILVSKNDLADYIRSAIGGEILQPYGTPSMGGVKGLIVKTNISADTNYRAIRLKVSLGLDQNNSGNENFSINIRYWNRVLEEAFLSRENYSVRTCTYVICYVDSDNTFSFYIKTLTNNHSGGFNLLSVISNQTAKRNLIVSCTGTTTEYVMGSHEKEIKITIS